MAPLVQELCYYASTSTFCPSIEWCLNSPFSVWVTETLWPDFTQADLLQAIIDYQKRERRYGGIGLG